MTNAEKRRDYHREYQRKRRAAKRGGPSPSPLGGRPPNPLRGRFELRCEPEILARMSNACAACRLGVGQWINSLILHNLETLEAHARNPQ